MLHCHCQVRQAASRPYPDSSGNSETELQRTILVKVSKRSDYVGVPASRMRQYRFTKRIWSIEVHAVRAERGDPQRLRGFEREISRH